jgi:hypothetical protein
MSSNARTHDHARKPGGLLTSRAGLALLAFLAVTGFLLLTEYRAHALGALIYLLPLACIVMHLFHGHGGHGGHESRGHKEDGRT